MNALMTSEQIENALNDRHLKDLKSTKKYGYSFSDNKSKPVQVRLGEGLYVKAMKKAKGIGITMPELLRVALKEFL